MDVPLPPDLEELYDEGVIARIDARPVAGSPFTPPALDEPEERDEPDEVVADEPVAPPVTGLRRFGIVGAVAAGSFMGLAEVFEPERARQHIIEFVPDAPDESGQLVTFHHVPGDPRASRIVVRPWLAGRRRPHRF